MTYRKVPLGSASRRTGTVNVPSNTIPSGAPPDALVRARALRIDQLWTACSSYERQFFSGGAHAQILECKLAGSQKARRVQQWILSLWREYYRRKDLVEAASSTGLINMASVDFSVYGSPPHSMREILADAPVA